MQQEEQLLNLIDSHCHLFYDPLVRELPGVIDAAAKNGVTRMITVGTDLNTSQECIRIAENHDSVYASVGIHPHDAEAVDENYLDRLREMSRENKVVALGEMGLDYFRNHSSPQGQIPVFQDQLQLARELDLPFIFHNRDADDDVYEMIRSSGYFNGVAHCFSSGPGLARKYLDLGLVISFSGNLTYKTSRLPEVAEYVPLERILVETDSPFLAPVPHRGKPNKPGFTVHVARRIAEIKKLPFAEAAAVLTGNTEDFFRLPRSGEGV